VEAVAHFDDPKVMLEVSSGLGSGMVGLDIEDIPEAQRLQDRGW
jgi:pyridoxal 5'-phosphate synthase pdxS subunit